jgi:hypothetical protein
MAKVVGLRTVTNGFLVGVRGTCVLDSEGVFDSEGPVKPFGADCEAL